MREIIIRIIDTDKLFKENKIDTEDYWDDKLIEVYVDGEKIKYLEDFSVSFNTHDNNVKYTITKQLEDNGYPDGIEKGFYKKCAQ